jgi:flagellar hook-associated protein 1 FlgK
MRAMDISSNNISNVNTPGFSRRGIDLVSGSSTGFGTGVSVKGQHRIMDEFVNTNLRSSIASLMENQTYFTQSSGIENLIGNSDTNLTHDINDLINSLSELNTSPTSMSSRNVFVSKNKAMADNFRDLNQNILSEYKNLERDMGNMVNQVNSIANNIASVNKQIAGATTTDTTGLQDQRDKLLTDLSEYVDFESLPQADGSVTITLGAGNPLVQGTQTTELTVVSNPEDPLKYEVGMKMGNTSMIISENLSGGSLKGMLDYRSEVLDPTYRELGRLALAMTAGTNAQSKLGMDLNGNLGTNMFSDINSTANAADRVLSNAGNTGTATLSAQITDSNALKVSDYRMEFTSATEYSLTRISDDTVVSSGSLGALPATVTTPDGFSVEVTAGTLAAGDSFLISPTRNAAQHMNMLITSGADIALASPISAQASTSNTGTVGVTSSKVTDTSNASFGTAGALAPPVTVEFLSPTSYQIVNADTLAVMEGPLTYDPAAENAIFPTPGGINPGYEVSLNGNAAAGDVVNIIYNATGVGDNSNGSLFNDLFDLGSLEGGTLNFREGFQQIVDNVAIKVNNAGVAAESSAILQQQAQNRRDSISAVNLDEEAVNLMQLQQAYQANAQVISIANSLFQTLIQM